MNRQPGARERAQNVECRHGNCDQIEHVTRRNEEYKCRHVGRDVHQLCRCRGMKKVEGEAADKQEDQEAASTGTEQTIVETDSAADDDRQQFFLGTDVHGFMQGAEIFFQKV